MNNRVLANLLDSAAEVFGEGKQKKYHFDFWGKEFTKKAGPGRVSFYCQAEKIGDLLFSASDWLTKAEEKKQEEWIAAITDGDVGDEYELAAGFSVVARLREASTLLEVAAYEAADQDAAKAEQTV
jgi:hypothetical protein